VPSLRYILCVPVVGVLAGSCGGRSSAPTTTALRSANAVVTYVVDGDTIDVRMVGGDVDGREERVRLIGIDTPETKKANTPVECFGLEATEFVRQLLPDGTPVYLERDVEPRDDYGRLLAYVYRVDTGRFVNLDVVASGYAQPLTIPPNVAYSERFVDAAYDAERADLGLWSACAG
jgi:micrococcal nuclease